MNSQEIQLLNDISKTDVETEKINKMTMVIAVLEKKNEELLKIIEELQNKNNMTTEEKKLQYRLKYINNHKKEITESKKEYYLKNKDKIKKNNALKKLNSGLNVRNSIMIKYDIKKDENGKYY